MKYIVTCSGGNDSVALIQFMQDNYKGLFCVLYNDTGWSYDNWETRIAMVSSKCFALGIQFFITKSEGMENLVLRKKGWPMPASNMQFCTQELKERPSLEFYQKHDPTVVRLTVDSKSWETEATAGPMFDFNSKTKEKNKDGSLKHKTRLEVVHGGEITIVTGRRREESQNRANLPLWQYESAKHGGRDVFNPIINFGEKERDEHIERFGFSPLPHSSKECFCICANKTDLASMPKDHPMVDRVEAIEIKAGFTKNKKPRTMFRPYRVGGGVGIRQAIEWGHGKRGWKSEAVPEIYLYRGESNTSDNDIAYEESTESTRQCDGGFCGN